ncbi:MAG: tRNA pseudouridine(55) synthase TruB [Caldimicrobium sp.]|nr:tRNA pseudouridine(55) synthase TruB [Caldimicrobium sp.]MCX7613244.1 tRNA pseudouridine(55) synthase TruB [Caldimicrobium sp.]MDW8182073.1 tRNA pseudouridine(55) synthase TruB [Caldimicrobium sp.]
MNKNISGILVLDKPEGLTSAEALEKVKRLLKIKKAGHGGTLDPIATGVLPIFLNQATKVAQIFIEGDKVYEGFFELGITTDTYDITGEILGKYQVKDITLDRLRQLAKGFEGEMEQIPPPFSAAKYRGRPLYKYARDGLLIPKEPKKITVYKFDITSLQGNQASFYLKCSKGTYVRSLIHKLGELLECGAVLVKLKRIQKSIFTLDQAITLEKLMEFSEESPEKISSVLISVEKALEFLPKIIISEDLSDKVREGKEIPRQTFLSFVKFQKLSLTPSEKWLRLVNSHGKLVAIIRNPLQEKERTYITYFRVFKGES